MDYGAHAAQKSRAVGGGNKNSLACQQGFVMASFPLRTHTKSHPTPLRLSNREKPVKLVQADSLSHTVERLWHICFSERLYLGCMLCSTKRGAQAGTLQKNNLRI